MNPYLTHTEIREFEDKIGYKNIIDSNIIIGKYLDFKPRVEWMVGTEESSCFHPSQCGYNDEVSQKNKAEQWLKEQQEQYPNGWVIKEGNKVIKREYYPDFHQDWNHLMEAIKRFNKKTMRFLMPEVGYKFDTFQSWEELLNRIEISKEQNLKI